MANLPKSIWGYWVHIDNEAIILDSRESEPTRRFLTITS